MEASPTTNNPNLGGSVEKNSRRNFLKTGFGAVAAIATSASFTFASDEALADNVSALGRDAAGVHYRQDRTQGLIAGEQRAIAYLQNQTRMLKEEDFNGFNLTKFNASKVIIKLGQVTLV